MSSSHAQVTSSNSDVESCLQFNHSSCDFHYHTSSVKRLYLTLNGGGLCWGYTFKALNGQQALTKVVAAEMHLAEITKVCEIA